jgi:hypothetical protein
MILNPSFYDQLVAEFLGYLDLIEENYNINSRDLINHLSKSEDLESYLEEIYQEGQDDGEENHYERGYSDGYAAACAEYGVGEYENMWEE